MSSTASMFADDSLMYICTKISREQPALLENNENKLQQLLSPPEFYGDLVYKFRKIIGENNFPYYFKKIIVHYKILVITCMFCDKAYIFDSTTIGRVPN